jgi:hypothetical protein
MSEAKKVAIRDPLVIMYKDDQNGVICRLYPGSVKYPAYAKLVCDLVGHIARAFDVSEDEVWELAEKERGNPTTNLSRLS